MGYTPQVLIIGGGVTGTGLARDLAMRGLEVTLVERGQLTAGGTGRMQGLLHSGARYASDDREIAQRCLEENRRLRSIADHCIETTGGLVVSLDGDDAEYFETTRQGCEAIGMDVTRLSGKEARESEPALSEDTAQALRVPDAAVDPFRLTVANAKSAQNYGATIKTHTPVTDVLVEDGSISGVEIANEDGQGSRGLTADYVVNTAGTWAGNVARMANLDVPVEVSRGAMVVMNDSPTSRVCTRCRPREEGDLIVPYDNLCILGTAEREPDEPRSVESRSEEVDVLIDELSGLVPELGQARSIRSYWGVWIEPEENEKRTDDTHGYLLVDHEELNDVWGMTSVVGGPLTTYRLRASEIADHVCDKFGINRECLTATEPLPGSEHGADIEDAMRGFGIDSAVVEASKDRLGSRASDVLDTNAPNPVLCDCQNVTRAEVRDAMNDDTAKRTDLNEIRIRTRAAMGSCQGGRCCHTLASELYPIDGLDTIDRALDDLVEERWAGQRHALWGEQLAQAMRNYERHAGMLNRSGETQSVELARFDSGPEWDEENVEPRGGGFKP